jgi:hypothetical protein
LGLFGWDADVSGAGRNNCLQRGAIAGLVNAALTRHRYRRAQIPISMLRYLLGGCVTATAINKKNLLGLADRPGNDIRARLLLALTALYVERATHTEEEKRQYAELAQRLIDVVDETTRTAVAGVLREHPTAPIEISRRLSQNAAPSAIPATSGSARVPALDMAPAPQAAASPYDALDPAEWGEAFFAATAPARRSLLALIAKQCEGQNAEPVPDIARADYERLDAAALQGRIGEFIREFARLLDLPRGLYERIINDASGEPIVVAAMAVHLPIAVLQRLLLLVNPAVGHSVERVFDLTDLAYDLDRAAAIRLLSSWRDKARREEPASPPAVASTDAAARERPPAGLRARFGALSERIGERGVTSRSDRESVARHDLRSR